MNTITLGTLDVSRFILGSNPISGFSHQSPEMDSRMRHYFTAAQIKRLFGEAESLGVTAVIGRADHHVMRVLMEHWDEGGTLRWIAQTCPEVGSIERGVLNALAGGASACFIHGGLMDHLFAAGRLDEVLPAIAQIRAAGLPAGIAAHDPAVHRWAARELDIDFHMCSYYNPIPRVDSPDHKHGTEERFESDDRQAMAETIQTLQRPVIHYKVMAAGRNDPEDAFAFARRQMRPGDAICVGIYDELDPNMLSRTVRAFCD